MGIFGGVGDDTIRKAGKGTSSLNAGAGGAFRKSIQPSFDEYNRLSDLFTQAIGDGGIRGNEAADIRSRALAGNRAVFGNAQRDINRQRSLQGGYSPNFTAAIAKLTRDRAQGQSDATINANASIAGARQQGRLGALGGAASLFGTSPGMARTFGQLALGSQGLQNNLDLGKLGLLQNQPGLLDKIREVAGVAVPGVNAFDSLFRRGANAAS